MECDMKRVLIPGWVAALILISCFGVVGYLDNQDQLLAQKQAAELKRKRNEALQEHKEKLNSLLKEATDKSNFPAELK